ncbi:AAA family ATPase [Treponema denticola]|uniref:AAA family ATPase n=1 Tax=Treponema denticola TaxID=158 RepID=UPI0021041347|nr:AAA family ATPase [Treponema denticola]UTY26620.1 ATP-binding protein [Treponema denticola]
MRLDCSNVGKVEKASIELNSITLIAGLNNTGKSTISKTLYCIFNSFYNVEKKSEEVLKNNIDSVFKMSPLAVFYMYANENVGKIDFTIKELLENRENITEKIITDIITKNLGKDFIKDTGIDISRFFSILTLSQADINKKILQNLFTSEFQGQIQNFAAKKSASINLQVKDENVKIIIKDNIITELENPLNLTHEAIYIDDPFVLDGVSVLRRFNRIPHRSSIEKKLLHNKFEEQSIGQNIDTLSVQKAINDLLVEDNLKNIYAELNKVCDGSLVRQESGILFFISNFDGREISIANLSTGLKTFTIIKTLLLNGYLEEKGTLILDEPEIHLHPEWQIVLAKIIVLLQKEYKMHILISSHSPYFIHAIEVYSKKEKINNPKFYLTQENKNGLISMKDVSANLEPIYNLLYKPLQELESLKSFSED